MKAVCIIASPGAKIDGDVVFLDVDKFGSYTAIYMNQPNYADCSKNGLQIYCRHIGYGWNLKGANLKIKALWFWHMILLRKSHVYLTGVLK